MTQHYPLVLTAQYQAEAKKWLKALSRGENVSVMFFPKTDRQRRLHQLLGDTELIRNVLGKDARYLFQMLDLSAISLEDRLDIEEYLARHLSFLDYSAPLRSLDEWVQYLARRSMSLIVILQEAEKCLTHETRHILSYLTDMVVTYAPVVKILSFFETDITHPTLLPLLPSAGHLFQYLFYYPLYGRDDTYTFLHYLEKKFAVSLADQTKRAIWRKCGGHFWLVKEAVREIVNTGTWSLESEGMRFRVETIYHSLLQSEQDVLKKVIAGTKNFTHDEEHSIEHLQKLNFLDKNNRCQVGLFADYLPQWEKRKGKLTTRDGNIYLNGVPLDSFFSRKEHRVFRLLLETPGTTVSRDRVAKKLWPTHTSEHYSDWAIDQVIARIRKRLTTLMLPPNLIQVVRGRGYKLSV